MRFKRMQYKKMVTAAAAIWLIAAFLITSGFSFITLQRELQEPAAQEVQLPFSDITGHWAEAGIMEMYARDVMRGYRDFTFKPRKPVTYLDGVVMLDKLLWGKPLNLDYTTNSYLNDEFKIPEWARGYIASALRHQIIYYSDLQKVASLQALTRQEVAMLAVRALDLTEQAKRATGKLPFTDKDQITPAIGGYVTVTYERGIMNGFPDNSFQPNAPVSRAEMALILNKVIEQVPYLKIGEISGFIKSVNLNQSLIVLEGNDGKTLEVALPQQYLVYLDDQRVELNDISEGAFLRVVNSGTGNMTVLMAQSLKTDDGVRLQVSEPDEKSVSPAVRQWVEESKVKENYLARVYDKKLYFFVSRGEQMTGGYIVRIRQVAELKDKDGNVNYKVYVARSNPSADSIVNQVISYPYALACIEKPQSKNSAVTFVDEIGRPIAELDV